MTAHAPEDATMNTPTTPKSPPSAKKGKPGRARKRPGKLHADKAHDFPHCRRALGKRGIKVRIARRGVDSSEKLGRHWWVVERTLAWLAFYPGSRCATSGGPTSTKPSSTSAARSSASTT